MADGQDDDVQISEIQELSESYSGLQYVVTDPTKQWPWGSTLAVNEIVDLVRAVPELLARLDALAAERDELLIASRECRESMSRAMTAMARDVVTINDLKARLAAAEAERDVLTARLAAASDSISDSGESSRLSE